jgi:hypothetical protein
MSLNKCACKSYFTDINAVGLNLNFLSFFLETSYNFTAKRPWLPVAVLDQTVANEVSFDVSSNFPDFFGNIMNDVLQASYNFNTNVVADPAYTFGEYGPYLAQRIGVRSEVSRQNRFDIISQTIYNFWNNWVTSGTYQGDLNALQTFLDYLKTNTDKRYWLAPGSYHISGANPSNVEADAILVYKPALAGQINVLILELDSIA